MNFEQSKENTEKNLQTLINKCWEDESFKKELIADPAKAIEELSGKPFNSKGKKVIVNDQTNPSEVHINIPPNPNNLELTEAELEAVAGGAKQTGITILWTGLCIHW